MVLWKQLGMYDLDVGFFKLFSKNWNNSYVWWILEDQVHKPTPSETYISLIYSTPYSFQAGF